MSIFADEIRALVATAEQERKHRILSALNVLVEKTKDQIKAAAADGEYYFEIVMVEDFMKYANCSRSELIAAVGAGTDLDYPYLNGFTVRIGTDDVITLWL